MPHVGNLIWDPWNAAHIARHDVTPREVEEVCRGDPIELMSYKQRIILIGPTRDQRVRTPIILSQQGQPAAKSSDITNARKEVLTNDRARER